MAKYVFPYDSWLTLLEGKGNTRLTTAMPGDFTMFSIYTIFKGFCEHSKERVAFMLDQECVSFIEEPIILSETHRT